MTKLREKLGSGSSALARQVVYRTNDAIEVDDLEWVDIRRRRVYYDDVLLVTYHEETGIGIRVVLWQLLGALCAFIGVLFAINKSIGGAVAFFAITALLALPLVLLLILKTRVITVYGRRSKARIQIPFRRERARTIYEEICERVRTV
ncbi:MAG TPA: hypothetical protein VMU84_05155 [Thermoanaerobaculia bacterium]|nr:hypothetical protein [Thermoanaerobaculia bacterium]